MKKTSVILVVVITVTLLLQTFSLAWISDNGLSSLINITGNVHKNYFEYGDGTADYPYGIASPVQLYYFAWLQYLGFFNVDLDGDDQVDTYYFELAEDLDMNGYKLPPIGTTKIPFLGNFNGKGHTISNLTVKNDYGTLSAPPNNTENFGGAEIIGFFGVVGALEGDVSYSYDIEANQISNFVLENITVVTQTSNALIGMIAGYVNGLVDKVGVVGSTVTIKNGSPLDTDNITHNMSDYGLIGFCTEKFKNKIYSVDLYLYDPVTDSYQVIPDKSNGGEGQGWGGSVKMYDIFTWLNSVNDTANNNRNTNYYVSRVDVIGLGKDAKPVTNTTLSSIDSKPSYSINTSDPEHKFGTFVFGYTMNSQQGMGMDVNFVGGSQKVTEYKYNQTNTDVPVYRIMKDNEYLVFNGTEVQYTTSTENATAWYITEKNGKDIIFTVYNNTVYYLTESMEINSALEVDHENLPSWNDAGNNRYETSGGFKISYTSGNSTYYLTYNNN